MANVRIIPSKINPLTKLPNNSLHKRRVAAYARVSTEQEEQARMPTVDRKGAFVQPPEKEEAAGFRFEGQKISLNGGLFVRHIRTSFRRLLFDQFSSVSFGITRLIPFSSLMRGTVISRPHPRQTTRISLPTRLTSKSRVPQGWSFFISSVSPTEKRMITSTPPFLPRLPV